MAHLPDYGAFLRAKVQMAETWGFEIDPAEVNPILKPHQRAIVCWMVAGGRRACFAAFGLGKSMMQLEAVRITRARAGGMGLIVLPLGVRAEFMHDAALLGITVKFVRRIEECDDPDGIYLTNYETVRDGKLDPRLFTVASLDEAACLRGFGGTKTFREFMALFAGDDRRDSLSTRVRGRAVAYRFVATATPSPNDYVELLAYSAFLGIMDVGQAKTRFFKRNSEKADELTIHPHKEREFWLWCASWGLFVQRPSDLGFSDDGYELPPIDVRWHEIPADHSDAGHTHYGQRLMFKEQALGVVEAAREKRASLDARVDIALEIVCGQRSTQGVSQGLLRGEPREAAGRAEGARDQFIVWCDLNDEQRALERGLKRRGISASSLHGAQSIDEREGLMQQWRNRETVAFVSKPSMYGAGANLQQCNTMVFCGLGFKFSELIQAIHRIHRFLQVNRCTVHLIYTEAEREVRRTLERKWQQHREMVARMTEIIREFGLSQASMAHTLTRKLGVERVEIKGDGYTIVNNDCVPETQSMAENSVDLVLTSIPFSTQYEYSPNYADFGHTDTNDHFLQQMAFLTPQLLRVLRPGRVAAIHVKDRIVPGGMTGLGFQTVYPFHAKMIEHYTSHGFAYMGMKTIVTDVVRENNQTYRLGWTEQCKDATKMGVGMPEYLLLFRKPPTSSEKSYADVPVVKSKARYTRSRWQIDAHGFTRSSGNRLLTPDELQGLSHADIFKLFREHSLGNVYDFEHHVRIGESLEETGRLPVTFMLLQPQSWSDDVWSDITRMLTLNGAQSSKGKEMHLCPMQFDIADRVIEQFSMPGETVFDPFGGLMTVPYRAILAKRRAIGVELSPSYFLDGAAYCKAAAQQVAMPSLFDLVEELAA